MGGGKRKELCVKEAQETLRESLPLEKGNTTTQTSRAVGAVQSELGVGGCGCEIFVLATCPLQFAKAGRTLAQSQQEKNSTADVQRGSVI
jgi:hypothetical protein